MHSEVYDQEKGHARVLPILSIYVESKAWQSKNQLRNGTVSRKLGKLQNALQVL